ncbi:hypothetical protein [Agromyces sp. CF514]|uniref:hypothetical protein n=1 Tax=Agromyces sp. CF514 TaxID=1881031 RepID=UPI000B840ED7|nr:hypothetical protein [Agromyces sp. CF514]
MLITVDDDPVALVELLWIRDAWGLHPDHDDAPPQLVDSPGRPRDRAVEIDLEAWRGTWPALWDATLRHAGMIQDPALFDALRDTAGYSPERMTLLAQLTGPSWEDRFGNAGLESFQHWQALQFERRAATRSTSAEKQPERQSLDALVNAWRHGLTKIVTIPCHGSFTRVIGPHALLVTDETRADPDTFSAALWSFGS